MLTAEQMNIIYNELSKSTADEFVRCLLDKYGDNLENLSKLLSYIPKLADKSLNIKQREINRYNWSTDLLLAERYHYPPNKRKVRKNSSFNPDFPTLLYTCLSHINPDTIDGQSIAVKTFFDEFVDAIKNKRGFDYENEDEWEWLVGIANGGELVTQVIKVYIDKDFVPPCKKRNIFEVQL